MGVRYMKPKGDETFTPYWWCEHCNTVKFDTPSCIRVPLHHAPDCPEKRRK